MRRVPLVFAAVAVAAGIAAGARLGPSGSGPVAACAAVLLLLNLAGLRRDARWSTAALTAVFVLVGALLACVAAYPPPAHDLRTRIGDSPSFVRLRGHVAEEPRFWDERPDADDPAPFRFVLRVTSIHRGREPRRDADTVGYATWAPAVGSVLVDVRPRGGRPTLVPRLYAPVEVAGGIRQPEMGRLPGLRGPRTTLANRGIHYGMKCRGGNDLVALPAARRSALTVLQAARDNLLHRITRGIDGDAEVRGVLAAMLLGYREEIPDTVWDPFSTVGAMHIFAISGLHVGLLAVVLDFAFRLVRVPRVCRPVLVLPLLLVYILMTGARVSAVRAFIMTAAFMVGRSFACPVDLLNILGMAAVALLAWDPTQVFDIGFQLSFGVVASLILVVRPVQRFFVHALEPDPFLPRSLVSRRRRRVLRWAGGPAGVGAASVGAWLGAVPLSAGYFHLLAPVALVGNMIVVPLATVAVALGLMSILAGLVLPWIGVTLNLANGLVVRVMVESVRLLERVPGGHIYIRAFPLWLAFVWYGGLAACFGPAPWRRLARRWAPVPAVVAAAAGLVAYAADQRLEVTFLALDGGECVFVDAPRSDDLLVDTGPDWAADTAVIRYLRGRGVDRLQAGVPTHPDAMHAGGAARVVARVPSRRWFSPRAFQGEWERRGLAPPVRPVRDGQRVLRGNRVGASLAARPREGGRFDEGAGVVAVSAPGAGFLLTSDAPIETVRQALGRLGDRPLVLQLPDHGRWTPGIEDLLVSARPLLCVAVTGAFESESAPDARVLRCLEDLGVPWRATHRDGSIVVRLDGNRLETECWAPDRDDDPPRASRIDLPAP